MHFSKLGLYGARARLMRGMLAPIRVRAKGAPGYAGAARDRLLVHSLHLHL
jgi:hypothetical protein